MSISAYSATPASNTAISGINLAEGCNASGINDAIRQMMADLAVPQFGTIAGIGRAPDAWGVSYNALSVGLAGGISAPSATVNLQCQSNTYFNGTDHKYINGTNFGVLYELDGVNGRHNWYTAPSGAAGGTAAYVERMRLTATGLLGIGMTPSNILDVTQNQNAASIIRLTNPNSTALGAALAAFQLQNDVGSSLVARLHGSNYATSGAFRADGGALLSTGAGGLTLYTVSDGLYMWIGSNRVFVSDGSTTQLVSGGSGGVQLTSGATSWAAISDYRAKIVQGAFDGSGAIIDAVPVHVAALKTSPDKPKAMFLAHEMQAAVPYVVHGEKDALKDDGSANFQTVETTDPLVPIYVG
jgi:hypothetical protein